MAGTQQGTFKSLTNLFKWLRVFFLIYIAGEILIAIGAALMLSGGSSSFGPGLEISTGDMVYGIGGLILLLGLIVSIILFCIFSYRAVKNIKNFDRERIDTTPGWAVGWYFIPFANLFKPYGVMTDMWIASVHQEKSNWETPGTMPIWWACWILNNIISNFSTRMGIESGGVWNEYASDVSLYKTTLNMDIAAAVFGVIAAWLLLGYTKRIASAQDANLKARAFE